MATGIREVCGDEQLISFHPRGSGVSSWWFHNERWLDFNMYQTGHQNFFRVYDFAQDAYQLRPTKPFVDGEPAYEDIPVRFWDYMDFSKSGRERVPDNVLNEFGMVADRSHFKAGFVLPYDVRVHAYWNFLSGAAGYTYGNNAIWQMYRKGDEPAIPTLTNWQEALNRPGANHMQHLVQLLRSRPLGKLVPDQSLVYGPNRKGSEYVVSASASDGSFAYIYLARGQSVTVNLGKLTASMVRATWFDPREGSDRSIGNFKANGHSEFSPPSRGVNNDWLLVLDAE
jgi:hypothetical protein